MTQRDRQDDIQIGDDAWIEWISLDGRYEQAIDIDPLLGELWPLICLLETHCVADCCGMDAYDFTREAVNTALLELDRAKLHAACAQAHSAVAAAAVSRAVGAGAEIVGSEITEIRGDGKVTGVILDDSSVIAT
ncbi:MAG: DUF6331 family protein, partial [Janthinobacterium sp.]